MPYVKKESVKFNITKFDTETAASEEKDCAVRALAHIIGDYEKAHKIFTDAGRKPKEGTHGFVIHRVLTDEELMASLGYRVKKMYKMFDFSKGTRGNLTMARLKEYYPQGKYFAITNNHAFALVDGVIQDSFPSGKCKRIEELYLFIPNN